MKISADELRRLFLEYDLCLLYHDGVFELGASIDYAVSQRLLAQAEE